MYRLRNALLCAPRLLAVVAVALIVMVAAGAVAAGCFGRSGSASSTVPSLGAGPGGSTVTTSTTAQAAVTESTTTASTAPAPSSTSTGYVPVAPLAFDGARAMTHIKALASAIGVRQAGTKGEDAAKEYVAGYLRDLGYEAKILDVPLPNGRTSHDLWATKQGALSATILVGAHMDSMPPAPGANDNASGVGVVLELARDLRAADITPTVVFAVFGSEEVVDGNADHHHYGSRRFVSSMTAEQASELAGMISVDMIAFGSQLVVRTMGGGSRQFADDILASMKDQGQAASYAKDPGSTGWSDHEAFEDAGYPVAWIERIDDAAHHTAADTYAHCNPALVQQTGTLLLHFLDHLSQPDLDRLKAAVRTG